MTLSITPYVVGVVLCPSSAWPCSAWAGGVLRWIYREASLVSFVLSTRTPQCFFWQLKALPSLSVENYVLLWNKTALLLCFKSYEKQVWCWQHWRRSEVNSVTVRSDGCKSTLVWAFLLFTCISFLIFNLLSCSKLFRKLLCCWFEGRFLLKALRIFTDIRLNYSNRKTLYGSTHPGEREENEDTMHFRKTMINLINCEIQLQGNSYHSAW